VEKIVECNEAWDFIMIARDIECEQSHPDAEFTFAARALDSTLFDPSALACVVQHTWM